jgi:hypothetical protein
MAATKLVIKDLWDMGIVEKKHSADMLFILLTMIRAARVTAAHWNKCSTVLEAPNIIIQPGTSCNPATLMLPPDTILLEHDCYELVLDQL